MVIVGGYETFVSRMNLEGHPDQPEWLSHVNASVLKVKLATAIIGISSIHLLKTFINAGNYSEKVLMWQTIIHMTFLLSALAIAMTDRLMAGTQRPLGGGRPAVIARRQRGQQRAIRTARPRGRRHSSATPRSRRPASRRARRA